MNERLTESFTRDLISQTYNQEEVYVNKQISSNQTIKKLLGNKKPDFIIDFKDNSKNIIVIIECKADAKNQK
ncbi:hypothetical protein PSOL_05610 [Candidatus Phytoplasma solani]|uniref:hypothetical protein n=1 Tax=Candidatus Phytoplasma solani TaxID=69896 RepID=UPI0032DB8B2D